MALVLYGIKNCDTMKKARLWLEEQGVSFAFHDYKKAGIDSDALERWARQVGWETLLNRSGRTFRSLPEADQQNLDEARALQLMQSQPSMIKRPVLEGEGKLIVGFKPDVYTRELLPR